MFTKIPRGRIYFPLAIMMRALWLIFSNKIYDGAAIRRFERELAKYLGCKEVIVTSSGTISLYVCLKVLKCERGDEIIVPAYTVKEVIDMIISLGMKPVFIDICEGTYNLNAHLIEKAMTKRSRFLLLTHMYGQPCDIDSIVDIAQKYNLTVVEDAAQALGAEYKGKKVGTYGNVAYFSFGLMKNLNTLGGGAVASNDTLLMQRIRAEVSSYEFPSRLTLLKRFCVACGISLFSHPVIFTLLGYPLIRLSALVSDKFMYESLKGKKSSCVMSQDMIAPYKKAFTNIQGAIGLLQLRSLDHYSDCRRRNAETLSQYLNGSRYALPVIMPGVKSIWLNYVIQVAGDKKRMIRALLKAGIDTTEGYVRNCAGMKEFKDYAKDCPVSAALEQNNIYIPIHAPLAEKHMRYIANTLNHIKGTGE